MDKRKVPRYRRRVPLRFWSQDDKEPRKGFTQNISVAGMFVSTNSPFKPGTRVLLEIPSGRDRVLLQAEVRFAVRVDPILQRVRPSGMGVRLLRTDEVMKELLKLKKADPEAPVTVQPPAATEEKEAEKPESTAAEVFPLTFDTPHDLVTSFERDIKFGGLFVAAPDPPDQDEGVMLEFRFAWDEDLSLRVEALVVKKFAAAEGSVAGEVMSGMGVAFSDPADVMKRFQDVIASLDGSSGTPGQGT